jgi:hypothetical protein
VLTVAVGYVAVLRDAAHRRDGLMLGAGVAGYFLALADQGRTGGMYRLADERVPGFVMMPEPRLIIRIPQTDPPFRLTAGLMLWERSVACRRSPILSAGAFTGAAICARIKQKDAVSPTRAITRMAD